MTLENDLWGKDDLTNVAGDRPNRQIEHLGFWVWVSKHKQHSENLCHQISQPDWGQQKECIHSTNVVSVLSLSFRCRDERDREDEDDDGSCTLLDIMSVLP